VTAVPPVVAPLFGATLLTGRGRREGKCTGKPSIRPIPVVHCYLPASPLPPRVVAVMVVLFTTTPFVAAVLPNVPVAPAAKFVPVIVTAVPPAVDPLLGATLLTVGDAR